MSNSLLIFIYSLHITEVVSSTTLRKPHIEGRVVRIKISSVTRFYHEFNSETKVLPDSLREMAGFHEKNHLCLPKRRVSMASQLGNESWEF